MPTVVPGSADIGDVPSDTPKGPMEGKVTQPVPEGSPHFTTTLTIGQHMESRRVDPGKLKAAAINQDFH